MLTARFDPLRTFAHQCMLRNMIEYVPSLMQADALSTKAAVVAQVPIGTPITQAEQTMRRGGFKCSRAVHERYADYANSDGKQVVRGPTTFLYCDSGDRRTRSWFVSKRWQVSLEDVGGRVAYVGVGVGLTGP